MPAAKLATIRSAGAAARGQPDHARAIGDNESA